MESFTFESNEGIEFLAWPWVRDLGTEILITTRAGGVSEVPFDSLNLGLHVGDDPGAVHENRRRAAGALGIDLDHFVFARQVHGVQATVVGRADAGRGARGEDDAVQETDALVTTERGVVLAMLMADCLPVVLYDPVAQVLANVHAGWRGTAAGVVTSALATMQGLGSRPSDALAFLGPAIDPASYQVGADVRDAIVARFATAGTVLWPHDDGRWRLDLWEANRVLLQEAGVPDEQIHIARVSTGERFFSDRAARPCGRFACLARLVEPTKG